MRLSFILSAATSSPSWCYEQCLFKPCRRMTNIETVFIVTATAAVSAVTAPTFPKQKLQGSKLSERAPAGPFRSGRLRVPGWQQSLRRGCAGRDQGIVEVPQLDTANRNGVSLSLVLRRTGRVGCSGWTHGSMGPSRLVPVAGCRAFRHCLTCLAVFR